MMPTGHRRTRRWFLRTQYAEYIAIKADGYEPTATEMARRMGLDRGTYADYTDDYGGISSNSSGISGREMQELEP